MTEYASDAPEINNKTDIEELLDFTQKRIEDPIKIDGVTIYHFSSHKPDFEALENAIENKLRRKEYVVPLQVTSGWTLLLSILPEKIKRAEILMYREQEEEYYAYRNMVRELPMEKRQSITQKFAGKI